MAEYDRSGAFNVRARSRADAFATDEGLRAYMIRVYNYMGIGLVLTGVVAYTFFTMAVVTDFNRAHYRCSRRSDTRFMQAGSGG